MSGATSRPEHAGLVVTSDLIFATKIRSTADALGLHVTIAATAAQAIELAQTRPPRLVVIDLGAALSDVSGLVATLRNLGGPDTKIVAYGAHVDAARLDEAFRASCDEVMPRSKFSAILPDILRRHLA